MKRPLNAFIASRAINSLQFGILLLSEILVKFEPLRAMEIAGQPIKLIIDRILSGSRRRTNLTLRFVLLADEDGVEDGFENRWELTKRGINTVSGRNPNRSAHRSAHRSTNDLLFTTDRSREARTSSSLRKRAFIRVRIESTGREIRRGIFNANG